MRPFARPARRGAAKRLPPGKASKRVENEGEELITTAAKASTVEAHRTHASDTGSSEVQVELLNERINTP